MDHKRKSIDTEHKVLSISEQCEILGIHRSRFYYHPRSESALNMQLMNIIDREFFDKPFCGVRWMTHHL
jgi:putative transposase